ncbi:hypothetical protein ACJX0J_020693, partial [Zea mays]
MVLFFLIEQMYIHFMYEQMLEEGEAQNEYRDKRACRTTPILLEIMGVSLNSILFLIKVFIFVCHVGTLIFDLNLIWNPKFKIENENRKQKEKKIKENRNGRTQRKSLLLSLIHHHIVAIPINTYDPLAYSHHHQRSCATVQFTLIIHV